MFAGVLVVSTCFGFHHRCLFIKRLMGWDPIVDESRLPHSPEGGVSFGLVDKSGGEHDQGPLQRVASTVAWTCVVWPGSAEAAEDEWLLGEMRLWWPGAPVDKDRPSPPVGACSQSLAAAGFYITRPRGPFYRGCPGSTTPKITSRRAAFYRPVLIPSGTCSYTSKFFRQPLAHVFRTKPLYLTVA